MISTLVVSFFIAGTAFFIFIGTLSIDGSMKKSKK